MWGCLPRLCQPLMPSSCLAPPVGRASLRLSCINLSCPVSFLPNPHSRFKSHLRHVGTNSGLLMARERPRDINLHVFEFHVGHSGLGSTEMREERLEVNYPQKPFSLPSSAASAELCFRRTQEQWRLLPLVLRIWSWTIWMVFLSLNSLLYKMGIRTSISPVALKFKMSTVKFLQLLKKSMFLL